MFPHEEFLVKALEECAIAKLVQDLGALYSTKVASSKKATNEEFKKSLQVDRILQKAALEISDLGPHFRLPHPMDIKHDN